MTPPILIALDQIPPSALRMASTGDDIKTGEVTAEVEVGELLTVVVVMAANVVRDIRENIRNLVGGRMTHYEKLIQNAIDAALADLQTKAQAKGYDGVVGVKISHPVVVEGGVEVIAYGNGFWLRQGKG
ncbi:MAG: heavy metal-binding domain-containing protein [Litorilinea sp.]